MSESPDDEFRPPSDTSLEVCEIAGDVDNDIRDIEADSASVATVEPDKTKMTASYLWAFLGLNVFVCLILICIYYRPKVAILVFDAKGFSTMTNLHKSTVMTSLILRLRQVMLPILHECGSGGPDKIFEADNVMAIFPSVESALVAARRMCIVIQKWEDELPDHLKRENIGEKPDNWLYARMGGIGIHYGERVYRTPNNFYGVTFDYAYDAGEYHSDNDILLTPEAYNALDGDLKTGFEKIRRPDEKSGHMIDYWKIDDEDLRAKQDLDEFLGLDEVQITPWTDFKFLGESAVLSDYLQLYDPELEDFDKHVALLQRDEKHGYRAERFGVLYDISVKRGHEDPLVCPRERRNIENYWIQFAKDIAKKFGGHVDPPKCMVFKTYHDALSASRELHTAFTEAKEVNSANYYYGQYVTLSGIGIAKSDVVYIDQIDVAIGSGLNIASKIGEDGGEKEMIHVSKSCFSEDDKPSDALELIECEDRSKDWLDYYRVSPKEEI